MSDIDRVELLKSCKNGNIKPESFQEICVESGIYNPREMENQKDGYVTLGVVFGVLLGVIALYVGAKHNSKASDATV